MPEIITIEHLLNLLAEHKGKIISTASMVPHMIDQARASNRMYVDENSLGYVWEPDILIPTTEEEVELFDKWYPLPVELPEDINNAEKFFSKLEKRRLEKRQQKEN